MFLCQRSLNPSCPHVVQRKDNKGGSSVEACRLFREVTGSIPVSGLLAEVPFGVVTEYYITEANEY